jgi:hypothetical protein
MVDINHQHHHRQRALDSVCLHHPIPTTVVVAGDGTVTSMRGMLDLHPLAVDHKHNNSARVHLERRETRPRLNDRRKRNSFSFALVLGTFSTREARLPLNRAFVNITARKNRQRRGFHSAIN